MNCRYIVVFRDKLPNRVNDITALWETLKETSQSVGC